MSFFKDPNPILWGVIILISPIVLFSMFLLLKFIIKLLIFIFSLNIYIIKYFLSFNKNSSTQKENNSNNLPANNFPQVLINNRDLDQNCLINLKLIEMMGNKNNNVQIDLLAMKQQMQETYFNQRIFELEMKQHMKELEQQQKQYTEPAPQPNAKPFAKSENFWDNIPEALKQIFEKLSSVEEMQFEILKDYTQKTHYNSDDRVLYVHPEDFLHINKALVCQKNKQLRN